MPDPVTNLEKLRHYLKSIEDGDFSSIVQLFAPDSVIEQLPNRIYPNGLRAGVSRMAEAFEKGRKLFSSQTYEIKNHLAEGHKVALEVLWIGKLAMPFGNLAAGSGGAGTFRDVL